MSNQQSPQLDNSNEPVSNSADKTMNQAIFRNGWVLALFAFISTGLIAITHHITKDRIDLAIEAALAKRLNELVTPEQYNNDVYHDCVSVVSRELLGSELPHKVYRMTKNGEPIALVLTTTAAEGYGGNIQLVVGVYQSGEIAGVRVTEHQETPGLGDKIEIEKSNWIKQFNGLSLENTTIENWKVKKDGGQFDALTGATITPRAVVKAVYNTLQYVKSPAVMEQLFKQPTQCGDTE